MTSLLEKRRTKNKGFALLMAVLISSIVLAIGLSMLEITLKQYLFSGIGRESEIAFYAADAGMECALYWDKNSRFDIATSASSIQCMGSNIAITGGGSSGNTQQFQVEWGSGQIICAKLGVTKYHSTTQSLAMLGGQTCPQNATCTIVESRGYNASCALLNSPRVVERALRANY